MSVKCSYAATASQLSGWYGARTQDIGWDDNNEPTAADHGDVLYNIGKSETIGRYMVARRDVLPEEVVFTDQPAVIGPDNSALPMCLVCYKKLAGDYRCGRCGWPLCGDTCRDSKEHWRECELFQQRESRVEIAGFGKPNRIYDAILPLRILMLKLTNKKIYRLVTLLMDHKETQSPAQQRRQLQIAELIRNTWGFGKDFSVNEVKHVLGILSVNSFVVHDGAEDGLDLIGLYPWTSLISHCCVPNVKIITRDDFSYICEATVKIAEGSEIVTSYHHYYYHLFGTMYRRADIKHTWSFDCICHRCQDRTELGTMVSAVNCAGCKYGYLLPRHPLDYSSAWECSDCDMVLDNDTVAAKLAKFEDQIEKMEKNKPEQLELVLRQLRYVLHENHYLITDCKRRLIDIYGHAAGFEYDKLSKEVLERKCDYCDHLLSLQAVLSPGKSEFRGYLLWERHGAMLRLAQWDWLRMKCTTLQYITTLKVCCEALREIIDILSPIRADSVEGANGLKVLVGEGELDWFSHLHTQQGKKGGSCQQLTRGAKHELEKLESQLAKLQQQTQHTSVQTLSFRRTESRFNRRSFVL